ncbi:putative carbohydrate-binding protein with CBM5 and CBM33 domain [Micromonospora pisi]|uniref:Putative carbohydrate-binding protein with CBM5 and CBM33 domain n=1 Tax=Micromonospora pisi TaxID=589240 RepID=A0A495JMG3_9ACTN|nr:lytic polysaccharide monooxygenase [Micromonospora pisi]RKR90021.1 putative carbohydrate-binding protein with CBM5 and CBM33 domain [Micromonospora pisi]
MRRSALLSLMSAAAVIASTLVVATPAQAHGYISSPPSRQANCATGRVANCGQIQWEPQSVEGPKGLRNCHANIAHFAVLSDESRNWPTTSVGSSVTFNWVLTARHATSTWEYYIGNQRVALFNDNGRQPGATVSHQVNLGGFSGRQKLLAIWNIADTANAFYSCVDLQIGGGGGNPPPNPTPTPTRTATPPPTNPTTPPPAGGTWAAGTAYAVGSTVTYGGASYRCRQAHTAIAGWEPPNVPALWQRL